MSVVVVNGDADSSATRNVDNDVGIHQVIRVGRWIWTDCSRNHSHHGLLSGWRSEWIRQETEASSNNLEDKRPTIVEIQVTKWRTKEVISFTCQRIHYDC